MFVLQYYGNLKDKKEADWKVALKHRVIIMKMISFILVIIILIKGNIELNTWND